MEDKNALVLRRIPYGESDWILSLFPESFESYFQVSLMARALAKKLIKIEIKLNLPVISDFWTNSRESPATTIFSPSLCLKRHIHLKI